MLYTIQWWKKPATGASTSVIVNAKLFVPFGTLDQCSVGAWFFPLQPEPGPPNSELTGSQPSSVKSGLVIVNGWKVAAAACAAVPVSEAASSAAPPMIKARSLRYMRSSCRRSMGVTIASWAEHGRVEGLYLAGPVELRGAAAVAGGPLPGQFEEARCTGYLAVEVT